MKETLLGPLADSPELAPRDIVEALEDIVLFTDGHGVVHKASEGARRYFGETLAGKRLWRVLGIEVERLEEMLHAYPPGACHELAMNKDTTCRLWIMPLPGTLAPNGGLVVTLTDPTPLVDMHEEYEEILQGNIEARDDSISLFNALFETSPDATVLADSDLVILSANSAARKRFGLPGPGECTRTLPSLFKASLREEIVLALEETSDDKPWTDALLALAPSGNAFPAEVTFKRVTLTRHTLFQVILRDLSEQEELEQDLHQSQTELEKMDQTLRTVIRTVEMEKQEMKEEFVEQVKQQVLPSVERLAEALSPDVRRTYTGVIKDQIDGIADGSAPLIEGDLLKLSPRQLEICRLIRLGQKGRDIAEFLNISFETLQTHRKNIRRKLGLHGNNVSLGSYLASHTELDAL